MAVREKKDERLEARCPAEVKQRIEYAAELQGRSTTDFIVAAAYEKACQVIEQNQQVKLTVEQSMMLADALINPPAPNAKAIAAMRRHKQLTGE
jgi:uncharacterized protein (DUF1778 family)